MNINPRKTAVHVLIQITDLHIFTNPDDEFDGVNTANSLKEVLRSVEEEFPEFDLMIVTGDLVQDREQKAYENMLKLMGSVTTAPVYYLPGNHDDPELMEFLLRDQFKPQIDELDNWVIFCLNSYKAGTHGGFLKQRELAWLKDALSHSKDRHALICLHHHPVSIGSPWMDSMMLENPEDFFNVVDQFSHIKGIVWGHIHQEFTATRNGVQMLGSPSTCAQFLPAAKQFAMDVKRPGYRWLELHADGHLETGIRRIVQDVT